MFQITNGTHVQISNPILIEVFLTTTPMRKMNIPTSKP
jgi:hypothetical protein